MAESEKKSRGERAFETARRILLGPPELATASATRFLLYANIAVYVAMIVRSRTLIAALDMPEPTLFAFGANFSLFTIGDRRYETLFTSCFLHASLLHIFFNLYTLRSVGPVIERAVGPARFFPLYLASGAIGSTASAIRGWEIGPQHLSVGASGAICGIIGAGFVLGYRTEGLRGYLAREMAQGLIFIAIIGITPGIDNSAHFGGAVAGAAIAAIWKRGLKYPKKFERGIIAFCTFLVAACFGIVFWKDTRDPLVYASRDARIDHAISAMWAGRCDDAYDSLNAAARLDPTSAEIHALRVDMSKHCPKN